MIISDLERSLAALPMDRAEARAMVDFARVVAGGVTARRPRAAPLEPVAIGIMPYPYAGRIDLVVDFDVLANDLSIRQTSVLASSSDHAGLASKIDELLDLHEMRQALALRLEAEGARGRIQVMARRILAAADMKIHFALERLAWQNELKFAFDAGRQLAWLRWRNGTLAVDLQNPAENVMLFDD